MMEEYIIFRVLIMRNSSIGIKDFWKTEILLKLPKFSNTLPTVQYFQNLKKCSGNVELTDIQVDYKN